MNKAETLALFAQGKQAWNEWAEEMRAKRKALEEKGEWSEAHPRNDATRAWFDAARADFTGHSFVEKAAFGRFVFPGEADFRPAEWKDGWGKDIRVPTRFEDDAWFGEATFSEEAQFSGATFSGQAWFGNAMFSGHAKFEKATFSGEAWFPDATFSRRALFYRATFSEKAVFQKATFLLSVEFQGATFSEAVHFYEATFSGDAMFRSARFEGHTAFGKARFEQTATFSAVTGESFFSLDGVAFHEAPDFEQAHFSEAPGLDASRYPDKATRGTTARWRALKRLAVQGHDHEREQLFFANELKSLRGDTDWLFPRLQNLFRPGEPVWSKHWARYLLGWLYQLFSDFGRSMALPVLWWCIFTAVFAFFYLDQHLPYKAQPYAARLNVWMASGYTPPLTCVKGEASDPLDSAIILAVHKGSVAGLGGSEKLTQTYACLYGEERGAPLIPDAVAFAGMVQTLLSAALIFLFLLAVRNHFRIK